MFLTQRQSGEQWTEGMDASDADRDAAAGNENAAAAEKCGREVWQRSVAHAESAEERTKVRRRKSQLLSARD